MLIGELALLAPLAPEGGFPAVALPGSERWTRAEFEGHLYPLRKLETWCRERGVPTRHPSWGSRLKAILPSSERALGQALADALAATAQLEALAAELAPAVGMPVPLDGRGVRQFANVLLLALDAPDLSGVPFDAPA